MRRSCRISILPSLASGMIYAALIARITRASMLDVLRQDYIRTAQAKGLANEQGADRPCAEECRCADRDDHRHRHCAARSAASSSPRRSSRSPASVGSPSTRSCGATIPIIQGVILVFSAAYVLVNLLVDLSYTLLDPRVRY